MIVCNRHITAVCNRHKSILNQQECAKIHVDSYNMCVCTQKALATFGRMCDFSSQNRAQHSLPLSSQQSGYGKGQAQGQGNRVRVRLKVRISIWVRVSIPSRVRQVYEFNSLLSYISVQCQGQGLYPLQVYEFNSLLSYISVFIVSHIPYMNLNLRETSKQIQ